ncbi:MAG: peptidase M48 [SAR202 cluster bacterium Io17-Chloro-G3]|nr:MAG: peptidase M48 [SAR202 cluster bacterium Io17-Chloro-G3]
MNVIFWVILAAVLVDFVVGILSTTLNIRKLNSSAPAGLEDVYEKDEYRKSQEYTRTQSRFGLIIGSTKLLALLIYWFVGGFNFIDQAIRGLGWNEVGTGLVFIAGLSAISFVISLPFSLYGTFVIEEKFGFNKTTFKTYVLDTVKGLVLSALIGLPLLAGILYFFEYTGTLAWLYVWGLVIVVSLVMQIIAPIWIMPIFNKFTPLEEGELSQSIIEYAGKVNFTYDNVYVIDGSRRSAHSNAFFTGFGKTKRIVLFDTLLEQLNREEIVSVIAHEVGHNKMRHILLGMVLSILHTGALLFLLSLVLENRSLFDAFFMENTSIYASIVFFGLLFTPVELIMSPVLQLISRRHEYQADNWAVETTANRQHLISGLKKLAAKNLANLSPHPMIVILEYSHPPLPSRIEAINLAETKRKT